MKLEMSQHLPSHDTSRLGWETGYQLSEHNKFAPIVCMKGNREDIPQLLSAKQDEMNNFSNFFTMVVDDKGRRPQPNSY